MARLRTAQARADKGERRVESSRRERDAVIHEALAAGMTHAQIAEATGLTRGRIGQIGRAGRAA